MTEIVNISYTGQGAETQMYSSKDDALITNSFIYTQFGDPNDNIEFFINDANGNLLDKVYNATDYIPSPGLNPTTGLFRSLTLDPQKDLASRGYNRGNLNIQYNFLRHLFNSSYGNFYWIKEVSTSRTEIKLASQNISNTDIQSGFNQYQAYVASLNYFNDFYLNFGNNQHIIAVNVAYTEDADGAYLLIKLYEPLPSDYDVKDQLWIVEKIAESAAYNIDIQIEATSITEQNILRGPNYNVNINQQVGQSTPYYSYTSLFTTPISSSFQKMMSYYQDRAVNINVDYSDFSNFIHFSSATSRVQNFATKVGKIETYNNLIVSQYAISGGMGNPAVSSSVITLQNYINDITTNFDTYEYYLYYASSSYTWPKSKSTQPYSLYSVTSSQAINWLGSTSIVPTPSTHSILFSASFYDATNKDLLTNTIPQYILDDSTNEPYISFVNMIGQHFDNVWIYYKDVTNRFDATNNPNTGISPDIVADALIGLGSTLYTNSNISDNLYYSLFGINEDGSLLPPTGSELISSYVTSSLTTLSANSIQKEIYKRIYHNIPYLYKTKGTRNSIDALINIFGIPSSILTVNEFGGYDRRIVDGVDDIYNTKITGSTSVLEISSSLLNPYTTIQYYDNNARLNSKDVEIGFSPSDAINSKITSSLGYFNIDQYIGNPTYQYSGSYPALDQYEKSFFSGYNYSHNIYEYIRLLKYVDNSLFKMVKDFVPARANLSEGLIVKSHVLERNKYQRHEPDVDMSMNFSESIHLLTVSGTDPDEIPFSTSNNTYSQFTIVPLSNPTGSAPVYGPVPIANTYAWEKYTGEFGGAEIQADYNNFDQIEYSSITSPWTSSINDATPKMYIGQDQGALFNNVSSSITSNRFIEAEYSYGINKPVNFLSIVSQSKCENCNRVDCLSYTLYNAHHYSSNYSYQACDNSYVTIAVPAEGYSSACMKPGTFSTPGGVIATLVDNCGTAYSSDFYGGCYLTSFQNDDTSPLGYSWIGCDGAYGHDVQPVSTPPPIRCVRKGSMAPDITTSLYRIIEGAECGVYSDSPACYTYTGSWTTTGGGYTGSYKDCYTGKTVIQYVAPGGGPVITLFAPCAQEGSFEVHDSIGPVYFTPLIYNKCANAGTIIPSPNNSTCTHLLSVDINATPYWYINYIACDGRNVMLSGSSDGMSKSILDCIRYDTLDYSQDNPITFYTGSLICGYYANQMPYTGSRLPVEIQEYNYNRTSTINSKYAGAKSISKTYNTFTEGDQSYGTSPATDYYVDYTGLFTSIDSSSYSPNQIVAKMSYMADISGGLQDLNLQNNNWVYFQNIYKPGDSVTIKQFNASQYSNQKYLDKTFKVAESGYSYQPYWYRKSNEPYECYSGITFGGDAYLSGSKATREIELPSGYSWPQAQLRDNVGHPTWTYGGANSFATIRSGSAISASWYWYNTSLDIGTGAGSDTLINTTNDPNNLFTIYTSGSGALSGSYYTAPYNGVYNISAAFGWVMYTFEDPYLTANFKVKVEILKNATSSTGFLEGTILGSYEDVVIGNLGNLTPGSSILGNTPAQAVNISLSAGDTIWVKISIQADLRNGMTDTQVYGNSGYFNIESVPFESTYCIDPYLNSHTLFDTTSFSSGTDTLTISSSMNQYFLDGITYLPAYTSGSITESPLYSTFGEVDYLTKIETGDYLYLYYNGVDTGYTAAGNSAPIVRRITSITTGSISSNFTVYPNLPGYLTPSNVNLYSKIIFTKRVPDETTIILDGKKNPGQTSYGFVVPENVNPAISKNINTLQSTIQSQILNY